MCIELPASNYMNSLDSATYEPLTDWLLQHAVNLEALSLCSGICALAGGTKRFDRLRHLTIVPNIFDDGAFHPATQLPALETLYLKGNLYNSIDVSGCQRLRVLVVTIQGKLHLIKSPTCRLVMAMQNNWRCLTTLEQLQHEGVDLGLIEQLLLMNGETRPWEFGRKGLFAALHRMEILTASWPAFADAKKGERTRYPIGEGPIYEPQGLSDCEHMLVWCMPENGMPVCNLQVLIINGKGNIKIMIPGALPNLRELVVYAKGRLELSIEQPAAMWRSLQTFCALGQPLFPNLSDVYQSLAQRRMILDEVFAQRADEGERVNSDASCIYLKPIGAPDVSVRELFTTVERLANKCRCGACFACLREAGSIKWGSPSEPAY